MSVETDLLVDRRRLKRRLTLWRVVGILSLLACVLVAAGRFGTLPALRPHVARLVVDGVITADRKLVERIDQARRDATVRAVLLEIDSPGGTVSGGQELHRVLTRLAADKPLVAVMGGTAASAGYMIAMPAARVFAREGTLTGSIGVLLQTGEISGLLGKLGITAEAITSGPLKDQPSYTRPLTGPGREVLQGLVADLYDQFVAMVAAGRHMTPDQVRALADGRAYTGRQALKLGLIDEIGGETEARAWLAAQRGIPADLPVRDLDDHGWLARGMPATALTLLGQAVLGDAGKSVLSQYLSVDGAWAIWHPGTTGE